MFSSKHALVRSFVVGVLVALSFLVFAGTSSVHAGTHSSQIRGHSFQTQLLYMTSLPNCLTTFYPHANDSQDKVCLTPAPASKGGGVSPLATFGPCNFAYYQNGPYLPSTGWSACAVANSNGDYFAPTSLNDQASSWASCNTSGTFYANQPNTSPSGTFAPNSHGNFGVPYPVPNDSLSSAHVNNVSAMCNLPIA